MAYTQNNNVYWPSTPQERQYFDQILCSAFPPHPSHSNPNFPTCVIHGRDAVPFLTKSKLPRPALKAMWSLVDPMHKGSLQQKVQFYTLLRMVSIGQYQMQQGQVSKKITTMLRRRYDDVMAMLRRCNDVATMMFVSLTTTPSN